MSAAVARPAPGCAPAPMSLRVHIGSRSRKRRGRGLNRMQADYLLGLLNGKSKRRAALDAGYAQETARNAAQNVEGKRRGYFSVMRLFVQAIEHSRSELSGTEEKGLFGTTGNPELSTNSTTSGPSYVLSEALIP